MLWFVRGSTATSPFTEFNTGTMYNAIRLDQGQSSVNAVTKMLQSERWCLTAVVWEMQHQCWGVQAAKKCCSVRAAAYMLLHQCCCRSATWMLRNECGGAHVAPLKCECCVWMHLCNHDDICYLNFAVQMCWYKWMLQLECSSMRGPGGRGHTSWNC